MEQVEFYALEVPCDKKQMTQRNEAITAGYLLILSTIKDISSKVLPFIASVWALAAEIILHVNIRSIKNARI